MEKILKYLFVSFVILFAGCDLDEEQNGFSTPKTFYSTREQCVSALNSCYIPLNSIYTYTFMIATEGVSDALYIPSGTQDAQLDISPAKPRFGSTVWTQGYRGVMYANAAIEGIRNSPLEEEDKNELMAEARIMRAFYYYILTSFFGDVPYYTVDVSTIEVLQEVGKLPRMPANETREALMEDIEENCLPYLEMIRSSEVAENRVGAAMALMVHAKMAMWNKDWERALWSLGQLEDIYGELDQYPLEDIPFRHKNTPESIFEIQHTYTAGGLAYTSNVAAICMPYPRQTGTSIYGGVEVPELGDEATTWVPLRPNGYLYVSLLPAGTQDKRRDMVMVTEWNGESFGVSRGWMGPKFWCYGMQGTRDSNNHKVFRYADVLLMIAECHCMLREDEAVAMEYLNTVKRRAGAEEYTRFRTWDRLMEEIRNERSRELVGEFQRKFDLVRWGIWYERTYGMTDYAALKLNIQPCHEYYPIPDLEVVYSGYALDNDAYKKYGL